MLTTSRIPARAVWRRQVFPTGRVELLQCVIVAVAVGCTSSGTVCGQSPRAHRLLDSELPPGAIGSRQLLRGRPLVGHFQPVKLIVPAGGVVTPASSEAERISHDETLLVGLRVGQPYRFRISQVPLLETVELYPSIEVIDRLYPPVGSETRFPVPVEITREEVIAAAEGAYITRVVYIEDPMLPVSELTGGSESQSYFEVAADQDPLHVADDLGRPIAILRMGARVPSKEGADDAFLFGSPPMQMYATDSPAIQGARNELPASFEAPPRIRPLASPRSLLKSALRFFAL